MPIISTSSNIPEDITSNIQETNKINEPPINKIDDQQDDKLSSINAPTINAPQEKNFLNEFEVARDPKSTNSIITSATQILKEGEHQWLNSEVNL